MLFQSLEYLLLLIVALLFIRFSKNALVNKIVILLLSMFFYAYGGKWQTLLFIAVILLAYGFALLLQKKHSRSLFIVSLCVMFLPLIVYKYVPFFLTEIFGLDSTAYTSIFLLPIGISFYTFQAVGYVIDVYRQKYAAERSLLTFACFISFFPQLVAGPIERADALIGQIKEFKRPERQDYSMGFRLILIGLCLKLLIAETMASFVDPVFNNLSASGGLAVLIATFCFGIQIYCDFNGYTQIALGSAKLMGINLMKNFDYPYNALTVSDFWRRWHISLTSWFRDYVYIPLGGNRKGKFRTTLNSLITFTLSGIWHGANWTYACWGFANGVLIAAEKSLHYKPKKGFRFLSFLLTIILVNLLWIFFRANSISDAFLAFKLIFTDTIHQLSSLTSLGAVMSFYLGSGWDRYMIFPLIVSLLIYLFYEYGRLVHFDLVERMNSSKLWLRWMIYIILLVCTLYFGKIIEQSAFVYFRF